MSLETIEFKGQYYPAFQATGNAARFCRAFASEVCKGEGLDIGYGKEEWKFPGATGVDLVDNNGFDAYNLPAGEFDYIHSSHLLEHLPDWVGALNHWKTRLKSGGILFMYLTHFSQVYWRPWNNRKHMSVLDPAVIDEYLQDNGYTNVMVAGIDLNNSFYVMAEKI
jgi:SAM-dependent methyltransferase